MDQKRLRVGRHDRFVLFRIADAGEHLEHAAAQRQPGRRRARRPVSRRARRRNSVRAAWRLPARGAWAGQRRGSSAIARLSPTHRQTAAAIAEIRRRMFSSRFMGRISVIACVSLPAPCSGGRGSCKILPLDSTVYQTDSRNRTPMAIAFTDQPTSGPFHRTTLWHRTAPRNLFKAWFSGDDEHRWTVWKKHLAQPQAAGAAGVPRRQAAAGSVGLARFVATRRNRPCHQRAGPSRMPSKWPAGRATSICRRHWRSSPRLMRCRTWPRNCRPASGGISPRRSIAWRARPSSYASNRRKMRRSVVRQQLLAGELPLALGYLFPELQPMRSLRQLGRQALSEGLIAVTDGEGLPHARLLPVIGAAVGLLDEGRTIGEQLHRGAWSRRRRDAIPVAAAADDSPRRRRRPRFDSRRRTRR